MQKIRIDFDNPGLPQHISAVENDSQSRFFQATLYENGKAYTAPEGATYSIMYRGFGPQNQGWYDTINDGAGKRAACAVSGNVVTCEIARQALQVPGHVSIVLCVTTGKGYMLKSWPIECDCKNDRYDSTAEIQSFFYITQVTNADWTQAIQAWENLKDTIDPTLSVSGKAADAKVTGDKIGELKEDLGRQIEYYESARIKLLISDWESGFIEPDGQESDSNSVLKSAYTEIKNGMRYYIDATKLSKNFLIRAYDANKTFKRSYNTDSGKASAIRFDYDIAYIRVTNVLKNELGYVNISYSYDGLLAYDSEPLYVAITCNKMSGAPKPTENHPDLVISKDLVSWTRVEKVLPNADFGFGAEPYGVKIGDWYVFVCSPQGVNYDWDFGCVATKDFIRWVTYKGDIGCKKWKEEHGVGQNEFRRWAPSIFNDDAGQLYMVLAMEYGEVSTSKYGDICRLMKPLYKKINFNDETAVITSGGDWEELKLENQSVSQIDISIRKVPSGYYCIYKDEYNKIINIAKSSTLDGLFTNVKENVFAPYCESGCLIWSGENVHILCTHYAHTARYGMLHTVTTAGFSRFTPFEIVKYVGSKSTDIYFPRSIFPIQLSNAPKNYLYTKCKVIEYGNSNNFSVVTCDLANMILDEGFSPEPNVIYLANKSYEFTMANKFMEKSFVVYNNGDSDISLEINQKSFSIAPNNGKTFSCVGSGDVYCY